MAVLDKAEQPAFERQLSPEATALLVKNGWDKGLVTFGASLSESTVKVVTAAKLLTSRADDFGFPYKEFKHVELDFNAKELAADGSGKLGVWSPTFALLSSGGPMPAVCMDGVFLMDTKFILDKFSNTYVDKTLAAEDQAQVKEWVEFNKKNQDSIIEAVLHWGWHNFHNVMQDVPAERFAKAYAPYGSGNKTKDWEKAKTKEVDEFFSFIESKLKGKDISTGCFVGGKTTLADCAMSNWYHSLFDIANFDTIATRYPQTYALYKKQDELALPDGAKDHQDGFTMFGKVVHIVCLKQRRPMFCCGALHDINDPSNWN